MNPEKLNSELAIDRGYHHYFRVYTVDHDQSICGESMCNESLAHQCKNRFKQPALLNAPPNETRHPALHDGEGEPRIDSTRLPRSK